MNNKKDYFLPFILTLIVIGADQISKILVVKYMLPYEIAYSLFGDFLNLRLVYNTGAAFSFGAGLNQIPRLIVLGALPLVALVALLFVYFKKDYFTKAQRWFICGIIGGGLGNLLDRFFRTDGVVDFIDVKFYGLFGFERWPTFNLADSFIVCCGIGLCITLIIQSCKEKNEPHKNS